MYRLVFHNERDERAPVVVDAPLLRIGRGSDSDLRLTEAGIGEQHAVIERTKAGYCVRDLGSANGVRVNGQPVTQQVLSSADELEIGAVRLRFEIVHQTYTHRRSFDALPMLATVVIAVTLLGQTGLMAWIFAESRPRNMRISTSRSSVVAATNDVPELSSIDEPLGVPFPVVSTLPADAAPLGRMIRIVSVVRADESDRITVTIQARAQTGERELETAAAAIGVVFQTRAGTWRGPVWAKLAGWENFTTRTFVVQLAGPPSELTGFVARSYYRGQLQDVVGAPVGLVAVAPALRPGGHE